MLISLDAITHKKLILVKQMYLRAVAQSQSSHNFVDRIFAVIGFDLANETALKAVVSALSPTGNSSDTFQGVMNQAENEFTSRSLIFPDKVKAQHVRNLRNDAQHKAKYPNETDAGECRLYTYDFLTRIFFDVWRESFESMSMLDLIQNDKVKGYLTQAKDDLANNQLFEAMFNCKVSFIIAIGGFASSITEHVSSSTKLVVVDSFSSRAGEKLLDAFLKTRNLVALQIIGLNLQEYLRYEHYTRQIRVMSAGNRTYQAINTEYIPPKEEVEYAYNFVVNAAILIENVDEDIKKPVNRFY